MGGVNLMAYPILYNATEKNFEHLGLSVLSDARKALVRTERNGLFTLEITYPINGKDVNKIKEGMILKADASYKRKKQRFVVSKITKTNNKVEIYAQHISVVKTSMNAIRPDVSVSGSAMTALERWRESLLDSRAEFFVDSDITTQASTTWKVENIENARDALGGKNGSILDVWGGEYEFDNLNIILHKQMGVDSPTIIAYGKNLIEAEQEESILTTYTSIFPFRKYTDEGENSKELLLTLPELVLDSPHANKFTHRRILKVDFSSDDKIKTVEQLRKKAQSYIKNNNVGVPKVNLKLKYQDLSKVSGVFNTPALEQVDLCDRLKVYYEELGIVNESAKVITTVWNVITEEYEELEIGDSRSSFGESTGTMARIEALEEQIGNNNFDAEINRIIKEREEAFNRYFNEKYKEIEDSVKDGVEKAKLKAEQEAGRIATEVDAKIEKERSSMLENMSKLDSGLSEAKRQMNENRDNFNLALGNLGRMMKEGDNKVTINFDAKVNELRQLANTAQQTGKLNASKLTELENGIQREFTEVKGKIPATNLLRGTKNFSGKAWAPYVTSFQTPWNVESKKMDGFTIISTNERYNGRWQNVYVEAGKTYEYGFFAMSSSDKSKMIFSTAWDNNYAKYPTAVTNYSYKENLSETFKISTFWKLYTFRFKVEKSGYTQARFEQAEGSGDKITAYRFYLKEVNDTTNTKPLGWSPHPEDALDDLEVTKSEFKQTADGLFSKVEKLEEYKNADGSRTQSLKNWVQQDTAEKLARERTEVNRIIDNKGFVKNEQFSNKFEENARGINRQLTELNNYKNADGSRQEALRTYSRDETARQLATERQSIERWVDAKGYATASYTNNKVTELSNSFTREISNVSSKIPTSVGGRNYALGTTADWGSYMDLYNRGDRWNMNVDMFRMTTEGIRWLSSLDMHFKAEISIDKVVKYDDGKMTANLQCYGDVTGWYGGRVFETPLGELNEGQNYKGVIELDRTLTQEDLKNNFLIINVRLDGVKSCSIHFKALKIEKGTIATDWSPAPEDAMTEINQLNTWKQTASETLNRVSSELNGTIKYSQLQITDNGINFGSGREFNGARLASMINTSPEAVQVLTNKMIVANVQNLVKEEYRRGNFFSERDLWFTERFPSKLLKEDDEYFFEADIFYWTGKLPYDVILGFHARYQDGTDFWAGAPIAYAGEECQNKKYKTSYKIPKLYLVDYFEFFINQGGWSNFKEIVIRNPAVYKKQNAELIVDGSITARQISSEAIEAGHIKAGSITASHIAASAITADKLLANDAMFDKFASNKAFIDKLWARDFMANYVKAVSIDASKITSGFISGDRINGGTITGTTISGGTIYGANITGSSTIKIGQHGYMRPTDNGLRFCLPESGGANKGVGVQMLGNYGRGDSPYGVYVYVDPNFSTTEVGSTDSYIMTVNGYINARGVRYLKFGEYTNKKYAYLSYWSNNSVDLSFGNGTDGLNDIYYAWDGAHYSIWGPIAANNSDRNLKENIVDTPYNALDFIKKFKFKEHDWIEGKELYRKKHTKIGLIAQDVQEIDDSLVYKNGEYLSLDTLRLANLALKAIQELDLHNKQLEQKIKQLEEKINE